MTGFEPWTSGIGSDRSTNWATTTAHYFETLLLWYFSNQIEIQIVSIDK